MELPSFPIEFLDLPDDQLGLHLFAWWVGFQAENKGVPLDKIPEDFVEQLRVATLGIDTDDARYTAVEKALRLVASGDAARGGKLFRGLMHDTALHLAALD